MENNIIARIVGPSPASWREESFLAESSPEVGDVYEGLRGEAGKVGSAKVGSARAAPFTQQLFCAWGSAGGFMVLAALLHLWFW